MPRDENKISRRVLRSLYASQDPFGFSVERGISTMLWNNPGKDSEGEGVIFIDAKEGLSFEWWMEGAIRRSALVESWRLAEILGK
jgi:hypothetical protein